MALEAVCGTVLSYARYDRNHAIGSNPTTQLTRNATPVRLRIVAVHGAVSVQIGLEHGTGPGQDLLLPLDHRERWVENW